MDASLGGSGFDPVLMQYKISGSGKPIVLVPGGLTGWLSWEPHAEILSQKRKTIRVQLLNVQMGLENIPLSKNYSVKSESYALFNTINELNIEKPFDIVAWSYGALTALDYVLDNPESVRTLTLIEPPALWVLRSKGSLDKNAKKSIDILKTLNGDITEEKLEKFLEAVGFVPPGKSAREVPQWNSWLPFRQSIRNSPAVVEHTDDIGRLKSFDKPVLLVKGTGSAGFLHQIIDALNEYLPNSRVTEMPAGHAPQIVSMDRFLKELEEFQK
jgi:pimeloyl-ACP methyl ester carboxylesterase